MKYKYLILIIVVLVFISQISTITALLDNSDNELSHKLVEGVDSLKNKILPENENHDTINVSVHSYDELKSVINEYNSNNKNESYLITLEDGDYNITEAILYRTKDNKKQKLIIDGKGHSIDGQNKNRFMHFDNCNITLKNLIVKNTIHDDKDHAGVFEMISPSNLNVINCTFISNKGDKKGSVVTNRGNTTIVNSTFINNTANHAGGAIWSTGQYNGLLNLTNNTFKENIANENDNNERTAIIYAVSGGLNIIDKNSFINNTGRCIHCYNYTNTSITGNYFHQNTLNDSQVIRGGVIDNYESDIILRNNTFDNDNTNGELRGGILYHEIGKLEFTDNNVTNTHRQDGITSNANCSKGGVIFNRNATGEISNNVFKNVMIGNLSRGCVIYNNMGNITMENNKFENTIEGKDIQGAVGYTDVAGIINLKNNTFNTKINGNIMEDVDGDKNIYNSNQPMDESSNKRGTVNYN